MQKSINYPIGIQTFEKIIEGEYLYVDKTALVYDLVSNNQFVFLSRPRRFGKSLLISTLEAYFKGRKDLFKGLAMERLEKDWKHYPVLRFDLSAENYENKERLIGKISNYLFWYEKSLGLESKGESISVRFFNVIKTAKEKANERVVILIDEYDKPLLDALHDDKLKEDLREELRGFYSVMKENDDYIHFAMLTGVTKFGHVSVFSGLNNLKDISLNPRYNKICGISETEFRENFQESVHNFAKANKWPEDSVWKAFKVKYDGYRFCGEGEGIYNPFSILWAFSDNKFGDYWFRSGTPSILVKSIKRRKYNLSDIEGGWFTESDLSDISEPDRDYHALFFQAGYLTIKGYEPSTLNPVTFFATPEKYSLGFPNMEVRTGFWSALYRNYLFADQQSSPFDEKGFIKDVETGNPQGFMERLQSLLSLISPGNSKKGEVHFQNELQIIFRMLGFHVDTEITMASGRTDMTIKTPSYVYIFEFKLDSTAEEAIKQIHDKGYAMPYKSDPRKVFLIGANFDSNTNNIDNFLIE